MILRENLYYIDTHKRNPEVDETPVVHDGKAILFCFENIDLFMKYMKSLHSMPYRQEQYNIHKILKSTDIIAD